MSATVCKLAAGSVFASLLLVPGRGAACSFEVPELHIVPNENDQTPPATPEVVLEEFRRARSPGRSGSATSCDDIARVTLAVASSDDVTPPEALGFAYEAHGQNAPQLHPGTLLAEAGKLRLMWSEEDGAAPLAFELEVWAVDEAGNRSLESTRIKVASPGDSQGCSAHGAAGSGAWTLALLLGLLVRRRKSSRAPAPKAG